MKHRNIAHPGTGLWVLPPAVPAAGALTKATSSPCFLLFLGHAGNRVLRASSFSPCAVLFDLWESLRAWGCRCSKGAPHIKVSRRRHLQRSRGALRMMCRCRHHRFGPPVGLSRSGKSLPPRRGAWSHGVGIHGKLGC